MHATPNAGGDGLAMLVGLLGVILLWALGLAIAF